MNPRLQRALAVLVVFAPASSTARAADPGKNPFVVLVGVGHFTDKSLVPRPTAEADAKALHDLFTDPRYLGVPAERTKLLLSAPDPKRDSGTASRDAIVKAVEAAVAGTGKDDLIVLAFLGRGAAVGEQMAFLTPESGFKDRAKSALLVGKDLEPAFRKLNGQRVLFLMDVHYRGFTSAPERLLEPSLNDLEELVFESGDQDEAPRPVDRLVLLAGPTWCDSPARGEFGLFTSTVLEALKGAADTAPHHEGYEPDGVVTTDELVKYLEQVIPEQAVKIGRTEREKLTRPVIAGARTSHFPITRNPAETEKVEKRLMALAAQAKAGTLSAELAAEGTELLARMPRLKSPQELRKLYQQLADGLVKPDEFLAPRNALRAGRVLAAKDAAAYAGVVAEVADIVARKFIRESHEGELVATAIRGLYRRAGEPLPPEVAEALKTLRELAGVRRLELLRDARLRLGKREDLDDQRDAEFSVRAMLASLNDRHTAYYDRGATRQIASPLRGRYPGVGVTVQRDATRDGILVVTSIKGSPAFNAGVQAGDLITRIVRTVDDEGKPLPPAAKSEFPTRGMTIENALALISGKPDTPITLVVERQTREITFYLKRDWIDVETVTGVRRRGDADWDCLIDEKHRIGYFRVSQFTHTTAAELKSALDALKRRGGVQGVVLDLRDNPGGYVTAATAVCELFVGREKLVTMKPREGSDYTAKTYRGEKKGESGFAMTVLVNGRSASASEIVAACLQDYRRAIVVGERTVGKGSVQDTVKLEATGGELKLTVARYYPPSDRNIDRAATGGKPEDVWGVKPDRGFEIPLGRDEAADLEAERGEVRLIRPAGATPRRLNEEKDRQLKAALAYLRSTINERRK